MSLQTVAIVMLLLVPTLYHRLQEAESHEFTPTSKVQVKESGCDARIVIHYHKTGNALGHDIIRSIEQRAPRFHRTAGQYRKRTGTCAVGSINRDSFFVQTAPNYFCPIKFPPNTCVVHMVRDTFSHIISSFLYHTQDPTPEKWVHNHDPCENNETSLHMMGEILGLADSSIQQIIELCKNLNNESHQYYNRLQGLNMYDGLRLEAARFMISDGWYAGSDILRLPNNILRLRESGARILTVDMQRWYRNTTDTMSDVLNFLFRNSLDSVERVQIIHDVEFKIRRAASGNHVTRDTISEETRNEMKGALVGDALLGSILTHLNTIISNELQLSADM